MFRQSEQQQPRQIHGLPESAFRPASSATTDWTSSYMRPEHRELHFGGFETLAEDPRPLSSQPVRQGEHQTSSRIAGSGRPVAQTGYASGMVQSPVETFGGYDLSHECEVPPPSPSRSVLENELPLDDENTAKEMVQRTPCYPIIDGMLFPVSNVSKPAATTRGEYSRVPSAQTATGGVQAESPRLPRQEARHPALDALLQRAGRQAQEARFPGPDNNRGMHGLLPNIAQSTWDRRLAPNARPQTVGTQTTGRFPQPDENRAARGPAARYKSRPGPQTVGIPAQGESIQAPSPDVNHQEPPRRPTAPLPRPQTTAGAPLHPSQPRVPPRSPPPALPRPQTVPAFPPSTLLAPPQPSLRPDLLSSPAPTVTARPGLQVGHKLSFENHIPTSSRQSTHGGPILQRVTSSPLDLANHHTAPPSPKRVKTLEEIEAEVRAEYGRKPLKPEKRGSWYGRMKRRLSRGFEEADIAVPEAETREGYFAVPVLVGERLGRVQAYQAQRRRGLGGRLPRYYDSCLMEGDFAAMDEEYRVREENMKGRKG